MSESWKSLKSISLACLRVKVTVNRSLLIRYFSLKKTTYILLRFILKWVLVAKLCVSTIWLPACFLRVVQSRRAKIGGVLQLLFPQYHSEQCPHITAKWRKRVVHVQKTKNIKGRYYVSLQSEHWVHWALKWEASAEEQKGISCEGDDDCLISSLLTPLNLLSPSFSLLHKSVSSGFVNPFLHAVEEFRGCQKKQPNLERTCIETTQKCCRKTQIILCSELKQWERCNGLICAR